MPFWLAGTLSNRGDVLLMVGCLLAAAVLARSVLQLVVSFWGHAGSLRAEPAASVDMEAGYGATVVSSGSLAWREGAEATGHDSPSKVTRQSALASTHDGPALPLLGRLPVASRVQPGRGGSSHPEFDEDPSEPWLALHEVADNELQELVGAEPDGMQLAADQQQNHNSQGYTVPLHAPGLAKSEAYEPTPTSPGDNLPFAAGGASAPNDAVTVSLVSAPAPPGLLAPLPSQFMGPPAGLCGPPGLGCTAPPGLLATSAPGLEEQEYFQDATMEAPSYPCWDSVSERSALFEAGLLPPECQDSIVELGRGGQGVVFGVSLVTHGSVAVKLMPKQDAAAVELARQEASLQAELQHPNVLKLLATTETPLFSLMVLERCVGEVSGPAPPLVAALWVRQLLEALDYTHGQGIVHRDVKPSNCLLAPDGSLRLADWGLAVRITSPSTTSSPSAPCSPLSTPFALCDTAGTEGFRAPEQLRGEPYSFPVDVWGVGLVAHVLLTGCHPFADPKRQRALSTAAAMELPAVAAMPLAMQCFLYRSLDKDQHQRPTAADLLMDAWLTGLCEETSAF